jgi:predicted metal-binding protein
MANANKSPWEIGSIFICTKCGAKFNDPDLADEAKSKIRKKQKEEETQGLIRVITSGCLGVCYPEKQTFAFMPVDGKTEIYTTGLKKDEVIEDITELMNRKIKNQSNK